LFQVVGLKEEFVILKTSHSEDNCRLTVEISGKRQIVFELLNETETDMLLNGEIQLRSIASFDEKISIPVLLMKRSDDFALIADNKLFIKADIITLSFILLSRYEETLIQKRDQYNRFEYKNSLARKLDFIDIPIVDEYAMLLRKWLLKFIPDLEIKQRKSKVIPTHDIDEMRRFGNLFRNIKTIAGGDIYNRKSFSIAYRSINQLRAAIRNSYKDPLIIAIEHLIEISRLSGLCSVFYFKGLQKGEFNATYDIFSPEVKYCMQKIREAGMVIGIHGGFNSYNSELVFQNEKRNIESIYGEPVISGRQHFLQFDINKTIQVWQNCGLKIDSTLGFAEREGFRCGTSHEFYLYDLKNDCITNVKEHPLIVMEGTLFFYRNQSIESAISNIEKLYKRCQAVEGDFVILWHNHNLFREYKERFTEVYCKFINSVS
jgi:hypothetical protein